MEIQYKTKSDIDIGKWDNCISLSINGIVYAYSWFLDIVSPDWDALVYGDYETVMPLTKNKKYLINYLYQPYFTQQLGIFSTNKIDKTLIHSFIEAIPCKFRFIEINLNKYNYIDKIQGCIVKKNITYELDLIDNYENIFRKYRKNNIRNIRKAIQNKISIIKGLPIDDVFGLIQSYCRIPGMKKNHVNILLQLISNAVKNERGHLYGAYNEDNTLCAVGFFVFANNRACFLLSAATEEGKEQSAMFLLIDEFIKDFSNRNIILDFEGSNIEGIARFYRGFGASPFSYSSIKINRLPFLLKLLKN